MLDKYALSPVSLAVLLAAATACGDSEPVTCNCMFPTGGATGAGATGAGTGGATTGTGGTGGEATGTGGAVTGGAGTGGDTAGTGGGGTAGTGGGGTGGTGGGEAEMCTGCARLSVPLAMMGEQTHFGISLGGPVDLSASVITFRIFVYAGSGGGVQLYMANGEANEYASQYEWNNISDLADEMWHDVVLDATAYTMGAGGAGAGGDSAGGAGGDSGEPAGFDNTVVEVIGLQINAGDVGPWTNPTVLYLDSVTISDAAAGPWEFTADASAIAINNDATPLAGSELTHLPPPAL